MTPTLNTIHNFRDCGGGATIDTCTAPNAVRCKCGRHLRSGRLYRAGTLDDARAADLRTLHTLALRQYRLMDVLSVEQFARKGGQSNPG
jgi:hypothetical protein